ncbi:hypothetical protein GYMLUDRAFT_758195 [Collybiopsis luxurians FD-317 M1]|uniref:Uncharacterized protein n=1 Tax=Collybiopsis luxurians FD-317 M1 TaxID=944289 RepID=A0A0D0CGT5_9AGAR|nr:hypothetical protein GYMLUDRAFT_758195 [Collybiopsis luxurians FD-317 M1]
MRTIASTNIHYLLLRPDYTLLIRQMFTLILPDLTPVISARLQMVDHLRERTELELVVTPHHSLTLLNLSSHEDLMELFNLLSTKRPSKIIAFLSQKATGLHSTGVMPSGDLYFATILCDSSQASTPNLDKNVYPIHFIWAAALRASPDPLTDWNDFNPTQADLTLSNIELSDQLQGPALDLENQLRSKRKLPEEIVDQLARSPLGSLTFELFESAPATIDAEEEGKHYLSLVEDFKKLPVEDRSDFTFLSGCVLFPFRRSMGRGLTLSWQSRQQRFLPVTLKGRLFLYALRSEFSLWKNSCPKFLL